MVIVLWILLIAVITLDLIKIINLTPKVLMPIYIFLISHLLIITDFFFKTNSIEKYYGLFVVYLIYVFFRLSISPIRRKGFDNLRLLVMLGGRRLIIASWVNVIFELIFYIAIIARGKFIGENAISYYIDLIICIIVILSVFYNGCIRVILTSKWLSVIKRFIAFIFLPIPIIHIFITYYLCHTAYYEYQYFSFKIKDKEINEESDMCKTKYPIVLIHGVGFRDFRFFNYWGRIPRELKRLGAKIYYGNQEALGTIEYNAEDIRAKIIEVIKENNCEKVNIIAHSKGGLDARYAISILGMEDYVASLTTVSTPHRGVKMVDYLCKLPDCIYKGVARFFDAYFRKLGDKSPDFYSATRAFSTIKSKEFNDRVKDSDKVYYQSYTTVLKNIFSDYILLVPYIAIWLIEGNNDGLVSVESAKWGEFKGIIKNKYLRGISHGDIIDLKREDYRGFDVVKWYVDVVSELKKMGY